ncbi:YfiH family protein [Bacilli bacterium PM5-9]|nr:YfiH family protein [Bacilli bacterium PM5-9]
MNNILRDDNILIITTNRLNGYSKSFFDSYNMAFHVEDNKDDVLKNYQILCNENNINYENIYIPSQTHSDVFKEVKVNEKNNLSNCDALYTKDKDCYIGVLTADCLPIIIYFPDKEIIAAIHAGWVGSAKLIAYKLINYLITNEKVNPELASIYLCPSISKDVYEVGQDVYDKIACHEFINASECFEKISENKYLFDNRLFNKKQLFISGINIANIIDIDDCTYTNKNYFSYRRDNKTGRQLSLIGMRKK